MFLDRGEIRHDGSLKDHKLYLKALEMGIQPGFPSNGREKDLQAAFPQGFFEGQLDGSHAVLRGLAKLSLSQSMYRIEAVANLVNFTDMNRAEPEQDESASGQPN